MPSGGDEGENSNSKLGTNRICSLPAVARTDEQWGIPNKPGFSGCRRLGGGTGRTRTNNQSVMECGRVRPAHPVEHQPIEQRPKLIVVRHCVELVGLEPH